MPTEVIVNRDGAVATLTLKSPDGLNVLSRPTLTALIEALDDLSHDHALRALVIAGAGDRAFSAGADLRELAALDHESALAFSEYGQSVAQAIGRFPLPTIAAIGQPAYGGGVELALACDFRLAAPHTTFHYAAGKFGILPGWGGTQRLPALIGRSRAKHMMILCRPVTASEALAWGLVDAVSDTADLAPLLARWSQDLAGVERNAAIQIKRALDLGFAGDFAGEREAFAACFVSGHAQGLIQAWLDKAAPPVGQ